MCGGVSPSSWRTVSAPPPASVNTRKRSCGGHACCRFSRACGGTHHEQHPADQGPSGASGGGPGRAPLVALLLLALLGVPVAAAQGAGGEVEVRVAAQRLADGRTEFALQEREADGAWGDRVLPRSRFFPANADVGRWLSSSPLTVEAQSESMLTATPDAGVEVRVVAQLLADGRMEFALQERESDGSWAERRLPSARFFPANADVGRWLSSSALTVSAASASRGPTPNPAPSPSRVHARGGRRAGDRQHRTREHGTERRYGVLHRRLGVDHRRARRDRGDERAADQRHAGRDRSGGRRACGCGPRRAFRGEQCDSPQLGCAPALGAATLVLGYGVRPTHRSPPG